VLPPCARAHTHTHTSAGAMRRGAASPCPRPRTRAGPPAGRSVSPPSARNTRVHFACTGRVRAAPARGAPGRLVARFRTASRTGRDTRLVGWPPARRQPVHAGSATTLTHTHRCRRRRAQCARPRRPFAHRQRAQGCANWRGPRARQQRGGGAAVRRRQPRHARRRARQSARADPHSRTRDERSLSSREQREGGAVAACAHASGRVAESHHRRARAPPAPHLARALQCALPRSAQCAP
jgi:hypothetical protein